MVRRHVDVQDCFAQQFMGVRQECRVGLDTLHHIEERYCAR